MTLPKDPTKREQYLLKQSLSRIGVPRSLESRIKQSKTAIAAWTPERRNAFSEYRKGKKHTPDTIIKMRATALTINKSFPHSPESKLKISIANIGRTVSEETKKKIGDSHRIPCPPEVRLKISNSLKGNIISEESRMKMSIALKGKKKPEGFAVKEKNSRWKGGISFEPYCPKFDDNLKERVRLFFGNVCVDCGKTQSKERLSVHHLYGNKQACCDNNVPSFVPLCKSCHGKVNEDRDKKYKEMIDTNYNGKCYLTKDEMKGLKRRLP